MELQIEGRGFSSECRVAGALEEDQESAEWYDFSKNVLFAQAVLPPPFWDDDLGHIILWLSRSSWHGCFRMAKSGGILLRLLQVGSGWVDALPWASKYLQ